MKTLNNTACCTGVETQFNEIPSEIGELRERMAHLGGLLEGLRPAPHLTRLPRKESRPAPRRPRRVAFALAVLAVLSAVLLAAPTAAQAQTTVWSATLTVGPTGFGGLGCSGSGTNRCSAGLDDDDFEFGGTTYAFTEIKAQFGQLKIIFGSDIGTALDGLTLHVGSDSFDLGSANQSTRNTKIWTSAGLSWTAGDTVSLTLTETPTTVNTPPTVANAIPDQSATAGTAFSYQFPASTFNDADTGQTLSYAATQADGTALPTWLSFTASTRTFSGTPAATDVGTVSVKVTASDGNGGSVSDEFAIVVTAAITVSYVPLANEVAEDAGSIDLRISVTSHPMTGTPRAFSIVLNTADGTATAVDNDYVRVNGQLISFGVGDISKFHTIIINDDSVAESDETFTSTLSIDFGPAVIDTSTNFGATATITITNDDTANNAPTVANPIPDQTATAGTAFSYTFPDTTFNDADTGDTLSYAATKADGMALPTWLVFTASTRTFAGTPAATDVGTVSVKVTATDTNSGSVSDEFDIVVSADTTPPTLTSTTVAGAGVNIHFRFSENMALSNFPPVSAFTVTADGNTHTTTGVGYLSFSSFVVRDEIGLLIAPAIFQGQAVVVTYTDPTAGDDTAAIQDVAGNDAATFTTGMNSVPAVTNNSTQTNTAPTVANPIPDQTATAGTAFSYTFPATTFNDVDTGDTLSYAATKADGTALPTWLVFTASTRTFAGTPAASDVGTVSVKVTASDGNGGSVSDEFDITVEADTTPPTLTSATVQGYGSGIFLAFSENLRQSNHPPNSAFTVTAGGVTLQVTSNDLLPGTYDQLALSVGPATILQGQTVVITYTDPTSGNDTNAIQDTAGNDTATFTTGMNSVPAVTNNSTRTNSPALGRPTITGTAQVGKTLTADTSAITDADGLTNVSYAYQWIRHTSANVDSDITGATSSTYTLVLDDLGNRIRVRVSFTDDLNNDETRISLAVETAFVTATTPPVFSDTTLTHSIAENTAANTNVGAAIPAATDADSSDTLTYTMEGADAASFTFDAAPRQIKTKTGVTYNFEAKASYAVTIRAADGNGGSDTVAVTITLTDVAEQPAKPAAPVVTATSGSTTILDVSWTAPGLNGGPAITRYDLRYRKGTTGNFTDGPQNVTGTSAAIGSLTPNTSYEVQVRATNAEGDGDWSFSGTGQTGASVPPGGGTDPPDDGTAPPGDGGGGGGVPDDTTPGANDFPTSDAGPDQTGVREGMLVTLDGSGSSHPEDDPLRYRWNQLSGEPVVLSSQNVVNPTFTAPQGLTADAVLRFRLLVTDPGGRFDSDTVTITVEQGSSLPGDQIYYFPHLAVGEGWQTTITYINYSSEEVSCQTDFLSDQGTPLMVSFAGRGTVASRSDVLPPGGSVHQETNVGLSAPLAPGWARAICTGPVKASLLYRRRNSEGMPTAEAGVNATTVPATRFVTFAEQGEGRFGTGVAYANPSPTTAVITFTARDADGEVLASDDLMLSPNGHGAQNMAPLFGLPSFSGSLEVTSTQPIVSLSLNFEAAPIFSSLPPGELDAAAQGTTTYYFPHLAVGDGWQTTITYINYSQQEVSCRTEFLSDDGAPLLVSFAGRGMVVDRTDALQPGESVHEETNVELNAPAALGWARATCSGPVKASLLYRRFEGGVPTGEAGVNAVTIPATRFVTFAEQGEGKHGTGVAYANPSDTTTAFVTFTVRDAAGNELDRSTPLTLLPRGHDAKNMVDLFGLSSFSGSLEVTSTAPIVSLSLNNEADPVFSSLPPGELDAAAQ